MAEPRHFCIYCGKPYEAKMIVKYDYHRGRFRECQTKARVKRMTVMCKYDCK